MSLSGTLFTTTVLVFAASTLLAVGLTTTSAMLKITVSNGRLFAGSLVANLVVITAVGWGLALISAPTGPTFIALVLAGASPGGPFGAKLALIQRGDAVAGVALMALLAVIGSLTVPVVVAFILSTAEVSQVGGISIAVGPLIGLIVASQVVPFFVGMAVRLGWAKTASRIRPPEMVLSNVSFLVILAWILMVGADDLKGMPLSFLLGATVLTVSAVLVGSVLSPGPMRLRTTAGALAGVRNAAPMLAVIAAEFTDEPAIPTAVAAIVLIELILQLPWNFWLAHRRAGSAPETKTVTAV